MAQTVISAAIMDLCHEGHLNLLKEMRKAAGNDGRVIMVLHDDRACYEIKGKFPIQSVTHRANNVSDTGLVNEVRTIDSVDPGPEFDEIIRENWDSTMLFMRGDDNKNFPGKYIIENFQIPIVYIPYTEGVSSSKLRCEI